MLKIFSASCKNYKALLWRQTNCYVHDITLKEESVEVKRNRLQYQSRKRGTLENCVIFSTFSEKYLSKFTPVQLNLYDQLLNEPSNDWDIYYWATGAKETPHEYKHEVMDLLVQHVKNYEKHPRSLQPKLLTDESI